MAVLGLIPVLASWRQDSLLHFSLDQLVMAFSSLAIPLVVSMALLLTGCGFFASAPVPPPPPMASKNRIVCSAWGQMGKRYRPGGASPEKGFDCSGLVWWSYRQNGIQLPRLTSDQAKAGKKIARKSAKPGDIVVFRTGDSPRGLHTGIYVGNGQFIHSPGKGKAICVADLGASYWRDRLLSIRRVR